MWYNEIMSDDIIPIPDYAPAIKRVIADSLGKMAETEANYFPNASAKTKLKDILATVLWDIATNGEGFLADGTSIKPDSYMEWLATVKYLITHLDGPSVGEDGAMNANVFKVYVGVNVDKI